jgi:hypothetical protein
MLTEMSPDAFLQTCHEARKIETRARIGRSVALREASDDVPRVSPHRIRVWRGERLRAGTYCTPPIMGYCVVRTIAPRAPSQYWQLRHLITAAASQLPRTEPGFQAKAPPPDDKSLPCRKPQPSTYGR